MCLATKCSVIAAMKKHPESCINENQALSRDIGLESFDICVLLLDRRHHIRLQKGKYHDSRRTLRFALTHGNLSICQIFSDFGNRNEKGISRFKAIKRSNTLKIGTEQGW